MGATDQWRWTDDQGVQRLLGADELRAALAEGRLKSSVLVWRRGMSGWVPARDVPELMEGLDELDEDLGDTITSEPRSPGLRAEPTPSIPPLDSHHQVAIGMRPSPRDLSQTIAGLGEGSSRKRDKRAKPDGGWKGGAARGDDEETVTRVRLEDEPHFDDRSNPRSATRPWGLEAARREARAHVAPRTGPQPSTRSPYKSVPTMRPSMPSERPPPPSHPPPPKRGLASRPPPAPSRPPPPQRKPSIPPAPKRSTPPPAVKSSAVLSEAFPSGIGTPRAPKTDVLDDGWVLEEKARSKTASAVSNRAAKTAPLPATRPLEPSRPNPPFADRPWAKGDKEERAGTHSLVDDDAELVTRAKDPPKRDLAPQREVAPKRPPARPAREAPAKPSPATPKAPPEPPVARAAETVPTSDAVSTPLARPDSEAFPTPLAQRRAPAAEEGFSSESIPGTRIGGMGPGSAVLTEPPPARRVLAGRPPALLAAGAGIALLVVLLSFFLGRATAPAEASLASTVQAKSGMAVVPLFARAKSTEASQRPCLMLRAPSMFASSASHRVPFETATQGERLLVGYARSAVLPRGMLVDATLGSAETLLETDEELADSVSRVVPLVRDGSIDWGTTLREQKGLTEAVWVNAPQPFVLGFEGDQFVKRTAADGDSTKLFKLAGKGPADAMRALFVPGKGTIVAYRQDKQIFYAALRPDGTVWHEPTVVAGSGGIVGKPDLGSNGTRVAVVFADKPSAQGAAAELRWSQGELGKPLEAASVVELPAGGPGGEAIAPAVASLPGNRWLLMWTEGQAGSRTLRAQTYDGGFRPIGEALRVSPATGSFGQGTVAAVGGGAVVLFLLATAQGYEVWGTVLQCR